MSRLQKLNSSLIAVNGANFCMFFFLSDSVSLESLMLKGERPNVWGQAAQRFGVFAAKFSTLTSFSSIQDEDRDRFIEIFKYDKLTHKYIDGQKFRFTFFFFRSSSNRLYTWLNDSASDEEKILSILPEKQRPSADVIGLRLKAESARNLLSKKESVALQQLTSDRIQVDANNETKVAFFE